MTAFETAILLISFVAYYVFTLFCDDAWLRGLQSGSLSDGIKLGCISRKNRNRR
jgi:hypothetical protein